MNIHTVWQSFRDIWVMELTPTGYVSADTLGSNALAAAMLVELVVFIGYLLS